MEPFICEGCPKRPEWSCPDLGLRRPDDSPLLIGADPKRAGTGFGFPVCPGFYRRDPSRWGVDLPWAVDSRSAFTVAAEARFAVEHSSLGRFDRLPAKLHDAIAMILSEESRRDALAFARQKERH